MRRLPLALLLFAALLAGPALAVAASRGGSGGSSPTDSTGTTTTGTETSPPPSPDNPCTGPDADTLRCPNLIMGKPEDVYAQRGANRTLLRGGNRIINVGRGPMELRGRRRSPLRAFRMTVTQAIKKKKGVTVTQAIKKKKGGYLLRKTGGELFFKPIPGQYRYWKFVDAGALEIWTLDSSGKPLKRVRTSPKKVYCLRDLLRMANPPSGSPGGRIYPGCNQDPNKRSVTIGTSVGWIDRYPSTYYQQYVDVTGLKGRFAFVMIADPNDHLAESDETDNMSYVHVTLPVRRDGYLPGY
jgi:hypothetical protein